MAKGNKGNKTNNFELVRIVDDSNKPVKQGVNKIHKDENGLIALSSIELNNNNKLVEKVKLTANSFHRALVENLTQSNIQLIDQIIKAIVEDAQEQANINAQQHLKNRLAELNNAVYGYKQNNINVMKEYVEEEKDTASIWDEEIDFYNMGEVVESPLGEDQRSNSNESVETNKTTNKYGF